MKIQPPVSMPDQIYDFIMQGIQSGEIQPGERLIETQIAEKFNISRTPVREAFRRLEQDGMVTRLPQRGVQVLKLTRKGIRDIFGLRKLLESYAVELACDNITHEELVKLRNIAAEARSVLKSTTLTHEQQLKTIFNLNTRFHHILYEASGSFYLHKIIQTMRLMVQRLRTLGVHQENSWTETWDDHERLIDHIQEGRKEEASELMKIHIEKAAQYTIAEAEEENIIEDQKPNE